MKTEKKEIDGLVFHVTQLPGRRSTRTFNKFVRGVVPALSLVVAKLFPGTEAAELTNVAKSLGDMDIETLASALGTALPRLLQDLPEEQFDELQGALFEGVQVVHAGKLHSISDVFDEVFTGRPFTPWKLMWTCIEVNNFVSFLRGSGVLAAKAKTLSPSISPTTP